MRLAARRKFGNVPTVVDGVSFSSKAEARRYRELRLLERAGEITGLVTQPKYTLQEPFRDNTGKKWQAITYIGDFFYYVDLDPYVEDVKGRETEAFRIKAKLFRNRYPGIRFVVVDSQTVAAPKRAQKCTTRAVGGV